MANARASFEELGNCALAATILNRDSRLPRRRLDKAQLRVTMRRAVNAGHGFIAWRNPTQLQRSGDSAMPRCIAAISAG
jgi:hypothetical protein